MLANLLRKLGDFVRPNDFSVVRAGGRDWRVTPAGAALFGPRGPDPEHWVAGGAAVVVKANPARTVYRVELPGGTIFVKHCRVTGPRAWGREVIRPPKARLEFENALSLRDCGVPAVEPLAWGATASLWPGESVLITRGLPAAVPFLHYLERILPGLPPAAYRAVRRQLAVGFGEFLAKLHDAGVVHPDPHPGNLLIGMSEDRTPHFALIDLHAVNLGPPVGWAVSRDNLALFNRWFLLRADRADRARFWNAYRLARTTLPAPEPAEVRRAARELERQTHASNLRFWARRESRCLGSGRYFARVRSGGVRGFAVRDLPQDFLRALLADPDAAFARPDARVLKNSASATVASIDMLAAGGIVRVVLKRFNVTAATDPMKNLLRPSHALRSWVNGHSLGDRWLPTPRPLAMFQRYRGGLPAEGFLLTEMVPDPAPLRGAPAAAILKLARVLRLMHDRGVSHRDLKAPNVLLAHGRDPVLIDLVGVRTCVSLSPRRRARELARLNASFLIAPAASHADRLRFLRVYLSTGSELGADWKSWWKMVSQATAAKVAKNYRKGRTLG